MSDDQSFARELPSSPNLEQLKKQAKALLNSFREGATEAADLVAHFERAAVGPNPDNFGLQDAQRVLARSYGFPSWLRLREQVILAAIKNGDIQQVASIIASAKDASKLFQSQIQNPNATNHAIGKDATLLQFASFRPWQGENVGATLVAAGAPVDLHSACGMGMTDKIEKITKANPSAVDHQVDTYFPIQYAISAGNAESVRCLMQNGDYPNRDLKKVAYFGWEDDAVDQDYTPWKPIHMASLWGFNADRVPVARVLAEHGADFNAVSPLDGFKPIHLVAMPNRVDMIRFFLEAGVDVNSRTEECKRFELSSEQDGPMSGLACTPLMVACGEGFIEATECLLEAGADVSASNSDGKTALDFANRRYWKAHDANYDAIIKLLSSNA